MKTFTSSDVKILEKKTVYKGYFRIEKITLQHRLFAGDWSTPFEREIFERGHAVAVLLYDPILNKVVFIEQFRVGALEKNGNPWLLELVAGIIEEDENPEQVAMRETQEEAGLKFSALIPIYRYWVSPGGSTETVNLFCARVDASHAGGIHGLADEHEDIKVWVYDTQEAYQLLEQGQICNAITIIALQWLQLHEKAVKERWLKD